MKNKIIIATIKSWNINDDNILGCDSSIKRFKKQGYVSYSIISREIIISRDNVRSRKTERVRLDN